jgi:hypothetical protein
MNTRTNPQKRVERKPLFAQGPQAVSGDLDKNFEYRFVNDIGSRISNFKAAGYEFVEDTDLVVGDSRVFDPSDVGSAKIVTSNDGTKSYLMRIKKEYYDEDQAAKAARLDELDKAMQNPASQGLTGGIKLSTTR